MTSPDKILGLITILLLLVWIGPNALRMNIARGTTTRHILIWLVILVALMWLYRFVPRY